MYIKNINERKKLKHMNKTDFDVTDGLKKLLDNWEETSKDEIDVWYKFKRD